MKAIIVGCGAMGGTYAGALARAGVEVGVIEASADLVERIDRNGLRISEPDGTDHVVRFAASTRAEDFDPPDFLLFFVKATHNAEAARATASLVADRTIVATVQNGFGHGEVLSTIVPPERLVIGVTYQGANVLGLGHVGHYFDGPTDLGPWLEKGDLAPAEAVAELLRSGGLGATVTRDVRTGIWRKLIVNAAYSPTAALTGLGIQGLGSVEAMNDLCVELVHETIAVAARDGSTIDPDEILEKVAALQRSSGAAGVAVPRASMVFDVEARRPTEIDAINGAVVAIAEKHGVPAPLNRALYALVKGLEHSWQR